MLIPHRSYCHSAGNPRLFGNPQIHPPGLRNSARFPLTFPSLFPNAWSHVYTERAGIPKLEGVFTPPSDLQDTSASSTRVSAGVTGMFHTLQTVTIRPRWTLPDSAGLPPGLSSTKLCPYNKTHSSLGKASSLLRSCAPSDYISLRQLCTQQRGRTSIWIYTQNTPNSARSHYNISSGIHTYMTTINNASLSHNSKHVRLLQERTLNDPDSPRHHRSPPPVKAAISHGDSRDSLSNPEPPSTNCFVHNI